MYGVVASKCAKHTTLGALLAVEMIEKCTPLAGSSFRSNNDFKKAPHVQTTFGGGDVDKVHAVVARSTFRSETS